MKKNEIELHIGHINATRRMCAEAWTHRERSLRSTKCILHFGELWNGAIRSDTSGVLEIKQCRLNRSSAGKALLSGLRSRKVKRLSIESGSVVTAAPASNSLSFDLIAAVLDFVKRVQSFDRLKRADGVLSLVLREGLVP